MTTKMVITLGLAEIDMLKTRITKKRETMLGYLARQDGIRDPLEKSGGSVQFIQHEEQAVWDLEKRIVRIREAIFRANEAKMLTIEDMTMSISGWLVWRREIMEPQKTHQTAIRQRLNAVRNEARTKNVAIVSAVASAGETKPNDILINIDEGDLAKRIDRMTIIEGTLDGQLSLINATTEIEIED